jgi:hypothetical protein
MQRRVSRKLLVWVSRVALVLGLVPLFFLQPLCDCPRWFIGVAAIGLVPLVCGPHLYRFFGGAFIALALLTAYSQYSHAIYIRQQIEKQTGEPPPGQRP